LPEVFLDRGKQADVGLRDQKRHEVRLDLIGGRLRKLRIEELRQLPLTISQRGMG
jgi:hypothetical protein